MTLNDIIELAKNGYKPSDIKELIALAEKKQTDAPEDNATEASEDNEPIGDVEEKVEDDTSELEVLKAELSELKDKLAKAQKDNVTKDASGGDTRSDEDKIADIFREMIS